MVKTGKTETSLKLLAMRPPRLGPLLFVRPLSGRPISFPRQDQPPTPGNHQSLRELV
jgi:hypothetical protein